MCRKVKPSLEPGYIKNEAVPYKAHFCLLTWPQIELIKFQVSGYKYKDF